MRAALIALAALTAGCGTKACKDGTLLLSLSFDAASSSADGVLLQIVTPTGTLNGASAISSAASGSGSLEVDFSGSYPAGASVTINVTATHAGTGIGTGSAMTMLSGSCAAIPIAITGAGGPLDLSMGGSDGGDLAMPPNDLSSVPDMATCVPSSASAPVFVDPALGADDAMHGAQPGGCAFKTITYALGHATGRINLTAATYSAGEVFPLVLNGTQILDGDPTNTGNKAQLVGGGDFTSYSGSIIINGSANQVLRCDISSPNGTTTLANGINCINVLTSGTHVIDHCTMHNCASATSSFIGISGYTSGGNSSGVTVTSTTITGAVNCINQIGNNWTVKNLTCTCGNDGLNGCGTNLTGCGNSWGTCGIPCNGCGCPANFTGPPC
jgi:hypothetical protein